VQVYKVKWRRGGRAGLGFEWQGVHHDVWAVIFSLPGSAWRIVCEGGLLDPVLMGVLDSVAFA